MSFLFYFITGFAIATFKSILVDSIEVSNDVKTNNLRNFPSFLMRHVDDFDFYPKKASNVDKNEISFIDPEIFLFKNTSSFRDMSVLPENKFIKKTAFNDLKAYMNFKVGILQRQAARNEVTFGIKMENFEKKMKNFEKRMEVIESSMQIIKDNHKLHMKVMYENINDVESGGNFNDQDGD